MGFKRAFEPNLTPDLTAAMIGIGMEFAGEPAPDPNIETTLLAASQEAMDRDDLRVAALLVTWFGVHHHYVNADRLTALVGAFGSPRVRALWASLARWRQKHDSRWKRLGRLHGRRPRVDLLRVGTAFQVQRHGEDPRFQGSPLRVPAKILRDRAADVLDPGSLAARHRSYRWRVIMGPGYRADIWAALETRPAIGTADLARSTHAAFATAWTVKRDFGNLASHS